MQEKIGHYTIVSELGRGGMGIVYKAREEALDRFVAIKVLTERLTEDDTYLQRFVREAKAAAGISHPNIVPIYYVGEDNGHPYFVMEYVSGRSLNKILREEGRVGNPRASQMILQAAHGLAAAHDHGIIHRDIKPANLILDDRGTVKIADFGLALPVAAETRLTNTGMLVGTPGYLSPEQCMGEPVDHRTDIYALGVTFYELLAGAPPFRGDSPLALLRQILDEPAPDVTRLNPDVTADTRQVLERMIAKDRNQRYQSCHEIVSDLEDYLVKSGIRSMTAGLATRAVPVPAPSTRTAQSMEAPTQALTPPPAPKPEAATLIVANPEPVTQPDAPMVERPTLPPTPIPSAPPPPLPPARSSSAKTLALVAIIFAVLVGGGFAAFRALKPATPPQQVADTQTAAPEPLEPIQKDETVNLSATITAPSTTTVTATAAPEAPASTATQPRAVPIASAAPPQRPVPVAAAVNRRPEPARPAVVMAAPPAPTRRRSGVAVAVTGDQGLVGSVSSVVSSELTALELDNVDAGTLPSTEGLIRSGDATASRLMDRLRNEDQATLLLVRVDPSGQRELSYMGRYETAYSARVTVTAYDLATGRPISGASKSATVEYTSRTADRESEKIVGPLVRAVARALQ